MSERALPNFDGSLSVNNTLASLCGQRVYFEPLSGNNGDQLIHIGAKIAIEKAGLQLCESPDEATTIIINGGGGMVEFSKSGIGRLRSHLDLIPEREIIVLPQSYKFETLDFGALFRGRSAPTILFSRERYSLDVLAAAGLPDTVRVGLDHDLAFRLRDSPWLRDLASTGTAKHVLIVERGDRESPTGAKHEPIGNPSLNRLVPSFVKMPLKKLIRALQAENTARNSAFVRVMHEEILHRHPGFADLPMISSDISDQGSADFDAFCRAITDAAAVASNRLHVGVFAALLGKPTFLAANSYHKIRGIAEFSMQDMPNVAFIETPTTSLSVSVAR